MRVHAGASVISKATQIVGCETEGEKYTLPSCTPSSIQSKFLSCPIIEPDWVYTPVFTTVFVPVVVHTPDNTSVHHVFTNDPEVELQTMRQLPPQSIPVSSPSCRPFEQQSICP